MKKLLYLCLLIGGWFSAVHSQTPSLDYYLPATTYDRNIPSPESFLGFPVGEWHVTHDQLVFYMKALAAASPRVQIEEYARSHEGRPLLLLTISTPDNLQNLESIRQEHLKLSDPELSVKMNLDNLPAVVYQGYSIHGNESSGANAALLVAYYLAAAQGTELDNLLKNTIVLLDPCYNPDGLHRFSTWVNMHKGKNKSTDPAGREFNETWPGGRTNHYWFDLNRDWLLLTHPESQGRIKNFHRWKPNILTDHHEMGSNSTFFFQPGVPSRTNPITPPRNQELTGLIGNFHAQALNEIGSQYYSQEGFDDFYYGKGSTYPDVNGGIGILFEQASSRGHLRETTNGLLSFPFTIRNQVRTSLSTLKAAQSLRLDLLDYQRQFYRSAQTDASKEETQAYVFSSADQYRVFHFIDILRQHQIAVYPLSKTLTVNQQTFTADQSYVVPVAQNQYRLVKAIFETSTSFEDSIFYDVSAWTMPLAFDLDYAPLKAKDYKPNLLQKNNQAIEAPKGTVQKVDSTFGYLFGWEAYYAPKALYRLLDKSLRAKLATEAFTLTIGAESHSFAAGTIFVPIQNQILSPEEIAILMQSIAEESGIDIRATATGLTSTGIDLGSPSLMPLKKPEVLVLVGEGVASYDAGEVWHLLDTRYEMPVTLMDSKQVTQQNLDRYNVIVLVDGSHAQLGNAEVEFLKNWIKDGGVLVAMERAVNWVNNNGLAKIKFKKDERRTRNKTPLPYGRLAEDQGADVIGGAIFQTQLDLTHPLCFGFTDDLLPIFRQGTLWMQLPENPYASPVVYTADPLLSGYVSSRNLDLLENTAAVIVSRTGKGRVICMADNPNFRGFWYGTNKLFANALFFGNLINGRSAEASEEE